MRSLLFVPADGGSKLEKGFSSEADAIIIDLEDSIAPERKSAARSLAAEFLHTALSRPKRPRLFVRINALATGLAEADLDVIVPARPDAIVLPKAEGAAAVTAADRELAAREAPLGLPNFHIKIIAQAIETAAGIFAAGTFRGTSSRLMGLTWGPEDLSAELGAEANRDDDGLLFPPYLIARAVCLFGAAAAGVPAIETVYVDFRDLAGLRADTEAARRDGFVARLAIHPAQVPVINDVFTPTPEAIEKANAIVAAFAASPGAGVVAIAGKMYDRPHLTRAKALLARVQAKST
jgi:citrate lyase subunit beta/citryl-CoA lyase